MQRKILLAGLAAVVAGVLALPAAASAHTSAGPPNNLTFFGQTVGTTSGSQAVTVNVTCTRFFLGNCVLNGNFVPNPQFTGAAPGDFSQTNNCTNPEVGGNTAGGCTFNVFFTPTAAGARTATLDVGDDTSSDLFAQGIDPDPIFLTGSGVAAAVPPPSTTVPGTTPARTGLRARAIKKCIKKFPKGPRRTKCIKKAKKLPV
jgi:hypothetical protein